MHRFVALEKLLSNRRDEKKAHFNLVDKIFEKDGKNVGKFCFQLVWPLFDDVANFFPFLKMHRFVALEQIYRIGETRKKAHLNFVDKNMLENEVVLEILEGNYGTLWMT